jgi:hypothetical protein
MMTRKLIFTAIAALGMAAVPLAGPQSHKPVTVKIYRLAQIDNLDAFDAMGSDKADFYALVKIGNSDLRRSGNMSSDDGKPGWKFWGEGNGRYIPIRIKINDDDGGVEEKDDYVDVNPKNGKKGLHIILDTRTGRITGDVKGWRGQTLFVQGANDGDKGKIWFAIS